MPGFILHHYDPSPFARKARLMFGLKGLAWRSVQIPMVMPKPDLMPLTGGYRKTPVLQQGADVYFDTSLIAEVLEAHKPAPSLFLKGGRAAAAAYTQWADTALFQTAANYALAMVADKIGPGFFADRAAMNNAPPPDLEKFKAAIPRFKSQAEPALDQLETSLADGPAFLTGDAPGLADLAVHHPLWMVANSGRRAAALLEAYPAIRAWIERVDAIGEGERAEIDGPAALAEAKGAEPADPGASIEDPALPPLGATVSLQTVERTPEPVTGTLIAVRMNEIVLRRDDPAVGAVHVHAPRIGFTVRPAK
jgi:glutathione S-transferase